MAQPLGRASNIRLLLAAGMRPIRIANRLKVSRQAVHQRMKRMGLKPPLRQPRAPPIRKERVIMVSTDFKRALLSLWGSEWREKAPEAFDTSISTLDRWANGHVEVPGAAGRLMEHLLEQERARKIQRGYEAAYKRNKRKRGTHGS